MLHGQQHKDTQCATKEHGQSSHGHNLLNTDTHIAHNNTQCVTQTNSTKTHDVLQRNTDKQHMDTHIPQNNTQCVTAQRHTMCDKRIQSGMNDNISTTSEKTHKKLFRGNEM